MSTGTTELPKLPAHVAAVLESVATEWDGCMCDAPGGEIDVGTALRESFPKRWSSLVAAESLALKTAASRVRRYLQHHRNAVRLDQEVVCVINPGDPSEAALRLDDLRALLIAVQAPDA